LADLHGLGRRARTPGPVSDQETSFFWANRSWFAGSRVGDAIEPGPHRSSYGGLRLEDLVLVTESVAEKLTSFPYDLSP
jgi:hypothetical protein